MRAIDTNVIVRILTNDDPLQAAAARALVDGEKVAVATSVFLETEWVLRSTYRLGAIAVRGALRKFIGHRHVVLLEEAVVLRGLDLADQGLELADALHVAATGECSAFVTFDTAMIRTARTISSITVEGPEPA